MNRNFYTYQGRVYQAHAFQITTIIIMIYDLWILLDKRMEEKWNWGCINNGGTNNTTDIDNSWNHTYKNFQFNNVWMMFGKQL